MIKLSATQIVRDGLQEIKRGVFQWRVWVSLAREDIWDQHRRTTLGPLWMVLNYFLLTGTFVLIFGVERGGLEDFASYVATGLFLWMFMSEAISMGVSTFEREGSLIRGTTLSLFVYVMRLTMQTIIRAAYSGIGWITLILWLNPPDFAAWPQVALGLVIIIIALPGCIAAFAVVGAFFPDMDFIVSNVMRAAMFLTPIFWVHGGESMARSSLYYSNPFTYFLNIVREPILGNAYPYDSLKVCLVITVVMWCLSILLLGALRKKIVYFI